MALSAPLALALPAAAASLAYLNARWRITPDFAFIKAALRIRATLESLEKSGELHGFSTLEELALDKPTRYYQNRKKKGCRTSEQTCLIFEGRSWTYKETYDIALRYAAWLNKTYSIKRGEIVAMDFTNCEHFIFLWFAIWSLGAVPAFINYNLTGQSLIHSIKVSHTRLVIVDPAVEAAFSPEVRSNLGAVEIVPFTEPLISSINQLEPYRAPDSVRHGLKVSDPAILIYTSGTTGFPKPAVVAGWKVYSGFTLLPTWISCTPDDRVYCAMPLYHSSASLMSFLCALGSGAPFIIGRKFSITNFWPEVRATRATIIQYVGETLRYLLSAPPSDLDKQNSVRLAVGNGLRPDVWDEFKTRFDIPTIAEFYAATESTDGFWNLSSNTFTSGAIGSKGALRSFLGRNRSAIIELDVITEEPIRDPKTGLCRQVQPGKTGEMVFNISDDPNRTPEERFSGYFNNKVASSKKMLFDVLKKGDAWFRTGDLMINDSEGRTYFSDRLGDTFRWKSENVSTNEVAEALGRFPAIAEANVYGVLLPHHDGRAGCAAIAFKDDIIPPFSADAEANDRMRSLATYLTKDSGLPQYAVPLFIRIMKNEEMERTGNNKQNKQSLKLEGVDLDKYGAVQRERIWWLKKTGGGGGRGKAATDKGSSTYVPFRMEDWKALNGGRVKL